MPEEKESLSEVEALRLEVERARLALDQASYKNEVTRTFLQRWHTDVQPVHETFERSREMAHGFAKLAIQMMFLLNGGALIAFPAFAQLVGTGFRENVDLALFSIGGFVLGLALIAFATLLAYISMEADTEALGQREEYVKLGLNQSQVPDKDKPEYDKKRADAEEARKRHFGRAMRFRAWSMGLGISSLVAFLVGVYFATMVLSGTSAADTAAANSNAMGSQTMGIIEYLDAHSPAIAALVEPGQGGTATAPKGGGR